MSDIETPNTLKNAQLTWLEILEEVWLVELHKVLPKDIFVTIVDLVTTCKGLLDIGISLQDLLLKLYSERILENETPVHRIAEDELSGFLTKEESLLLDNIFSKEMFRFFTEPVSTLGK